MERKMQTTLTRSQPLTNKALQAPGAEPLTSTTNKARAKAEPKTAKTALQVRLDSIFANLKAGQEKLRTAHDVLEHTDLGDAVETLLRTVIENMLPAAVEPIYRKPLTVADVRAAYTGMFPALAAIDGVIALAREHVVEDRLREAWVQLDEANSAMDFADLEHDLPDVTDQTENNFMKGKALLCALLRTSDMYVDGDVSSLISNYREDTDSIYVPQMNYAEPILRRLIDNPALLDGFSGALSQALATVDFEGSEEIIALASYKACRALNPYSETLDVNYTAPSLDEQMTALGFPITDQLPPKAKRQAPAARSADQTSTDWDEEAIRDIDCAISEAIGVMRARSHDAQTELLFGAIYAAEHAQAELAKGIDSKDYDECEMASAPLGVARVVLNSALAIFDDQALHGAWRLIDLAKTRLDDEIGRWIKTVNGRAQ
jgi:hypothetical protein